MSCASIERVKSAFEHNVLDLHTAKEQGRHVVGTYCIYSPAEIILAAGAIPVSLCGTKNDSIPAAEDFLPRSICPLIKSSFGFAVKDSCPYLAASDLVVADTTCDGKKKMFEYLAKYKEIFLLQLPSRQDADALDWWIAQFRLLIAHLESRFHTRITDEKLHDAIVLMNRERRAVKKVMDAAKRNPSPLSGMEMVELAFKTSFFPNKEAGIALLEDVAAELDAMKPEGMRRPRILVTGTPIGMGSHKVVQLIEQCGGSVVCLDVCSCYKKTRLIIDENADPIPALAERYLTVPCAVMSPNPGRYDALGELIREFSIDGVVDLTWQGCQTYAIESGSLKTFVRDALGTPFINIETDYSSTDTEQLKVRIEAFLEMLV